MKIFKRGTPPGPWWAGVWGCRDCGSEWQVESTDPVVSGSDKRDGQFAHMPCPVCGKDTWVSPQGLRERNVRPDWQS